MLNKINQEIGICTEGKRCNYKTKVLLYCQTLTRLKLSTFNRLMSMKYSISSLAKLDMHISNQHTTISKSMSFRAKSFLNVSHSIFSSELKPQSTCPLNCFRAPLQPQMQIQAMKLKPGFRWAISDPRPTWGLDTISRSFSESCSTPRILQILELSWITKDAIFSPIPLLCIKTNLRMGAAFQFPSLSLCSATIKLHYTNA